MADTTTDLLEAVKTQVGDSRFDDLAEHYLNVAKWAVIERLYPYDQEKTWEDVPERHWHVAVDIATYLINKRGAEGETSHTESGATHVYESADIPASMLRGLTAYVGVL